MLGCRGGYPPISQCFRGETSVDLTSLFLQLAHAAIMVNFPKELKSYCRHEQCKNHQDWRVSQYKVHAFAYPSLLIAPLSSMLSCPFFAFAFAPPVVF
jgi:hypothetical protein